MIYGYIYYLWEKAYSQYKWALVIIGVKNWNSLHSENQYFNYSNG